MATSSMARRLSKHAAGEDAAPIMSTIPVNAGRMPENWQEANGPDGTYYWNTVTSEVSRMRPALPPTNGPVPMPMPAPDGASLPRRTSFRMDQGSNIQLKLPSDDKYRAIYGAKAPEVDALRRSLGHMESAVRLGATTSQPLPPPPFAHAPIPPFPPPPGPGTQLPPPAMPPPPNIVPPAVAAPMALMPPQAASAGPGTSTSAPLPTAGASTGAKGNAVVDSPRSHRFRALPYLARNMACISIVIQLWGGIITLASPVYRMGVDEPNGLDIVLPSPYGIAVGLMGVLSAVLMASFERWSWLRDEGLVMPWLWSARVVLYIGFAMPGLFAVISSSSPLMPPFLGSICFLLTGLMQMLSLWLSVLPTAKEWGWLWFSQSKSKKKTQQELGTTDDSFREVVLRAPIRIAKQALEQNTFGRTLFLVLYVSLNAGLYAEAYLRHERSNIGRALRGESFYACDGRPCPTDTDGGTGGVLIPPTPLLQPPPEGVGAGKWFPVAKGFGQLLNLNCAVMLLPVVRSAVMFMHDLTSLRKNGCLSWLPFFVPFDKNIVFHKACAKYFILPSIVGHATAHYFNYQYAPYYNAVLASAGLPGFVPHQPFEWSWSPASTGASGWVAAGFTGNMLMLTYLAIYSGANDQVKRKHYETFWYSHHFFVAWFVLLLLHGPVWWQWALPTLVPYVLDRLLLRVLFRASKPMALARVYFWGKPGEPDVITLQFDNAISDKGAKPVQYMEGHYLYLQCGAIEGSRFSLLREWHPFTISSAPDEPFLEVNIRVMPSKYSWTNKLARYLMLFDPKQTGEVELVTRNPTTGEITLGKVLGPDGKPLFRIDAPHGAPSQHVFRYNTCMLVGAGIGVTPCAAILKGIVHFRWKKGFSPTNLHFFWVARLADLSSFRWLLLLLPELKRMQLVHNTYYAGDEERTQQLRMRMSQLQDAVNSDPNRPPPPGKLPAGWVESRTPTGELYYLNQLTNETSWSAPTAPSATPQNHAELEQIRAGLREASTNTRFLSITLYLTGCTKEQIEPQANPEPNSPGEMINALISTKDPQTGEPYLYIKAGRPDWDAEFKSVAQKYGREDVGVVFCGAPAIAEQLKRACEKHSDSKQALFRLHKENF